MTPDFQAYLQKKDIPGYVTALGEEAAKGDAGSLHVLLYLAIRNSAVEDALDFAESLTDAGDRYAADILAPMLYDAVKKLNKEIGECNDDAKYRQLLGERFHAAYAEGEKKYMKAHPDCKPVAGLFGEQEKQVLQAFMNLIGKTYFVTPDIDAYSKVDDILGYFKALWQGVEKGDLGSMHILLYLASQTSATVDALDILLKMKEVDREYATLFFDEFNRKFEQMSEEDKNDHWKLGAVTKEVHCMVDIAYCARHPEFRSAFKMFKPDMDIILWRAYCDNVGRQPLPGEPEEDMPLKDCAPQEKKDYWQRLYSRSDCSSNQEAIYNDALGYAEQGDPYAMFIVGYLLNHGIRTKYSNPNVTILEANHAKALPWLKRAADAGIAKACWETACALWDACYVSSDADSCTPEMRHYIEKGALLNEPNSLEWMFKNAKSDEEAFGYLVRLAEEYRSHAYRLELAKRYDAGKGCAKDEKKAFELVEYVYRHSSASPYDSSYEDAVEVLCRYLREGIGCEKDPERAGRIYSSYVDEEDRMWELLTK